MAVSKLTIAIGLVLGLAACATPEQRCVSAATKNLRTVDRLIAQTEATLKRGFALKRETRVGTRFTFCASTKSPSGFRFCNRQSLEERLVPVAVDLNEERRKLKSLKAKRVQLHRAASKAVVACNSGLPS